MCPNHITPRTYNFKDLTGQTFGKLTVIGIDDTPRNLSRKRIYWFCRCTCGNVTSIETHKLRSGHTASCGCAGSRTTMGDRTRTHGKRHTPEYETWAHILQRCHNPNDTGYYKYGARGITVCDRWRDSFENFLADMGKRPSPRHSIDRIDNNGTYSPDNCRWATKNVQANNTRRNHILTYNGRSQTMTEWAIEVDIPYSVLIQRINKLHWTVERALTEPVRKQGK